MLDGRGNVFVLSAPSGAGKSTLARRLVANLDRLIFSISYTTRSPRPGEVDGRDYHFVDGATFDRMIAQHDLLEWVQVYANRYGTGRSWVEAQLDAGRDVLLDIETIGARNVHTAMPEAIMIFLLPPSAEELSRRLRGRGSETEEQIQLRLGHARHEMEQMSAYDHLVVNEDLETAYRDLESIILAARTRRTRMEARAQAILHGFGTTL